MNDLPKTMGYYGGKAYGGKAEWIIGLLPAPHKTQLYAEPFGGMAGVLMARQPAGCEIVNDLNGRIINWWQVVRDAPDEFAALVEFTPHSRTAFERAISDMDDPALPPIRRALAFHIVVTQNIRSTDNAKHSSDWRISYRRFKSAEWTAQRIFALARRMRRVQLECKPAVDFMARIADNADAVVYVDPPYQSADVSPYAVTARGGLTEALRAQRGFVAVSGYGDEWEHLGWHRYEMSASRMNIGKAAGEARTEVLWLNREPPQRLF